MLICPPGSRRLFQVQGCLESAICSGEPDDPRVSDHPTVVQLGGPRKDGFKVYRRKLRGR